MTAKTDPQPTLKAAKILQAKLLNLERIVVGTDRVKKRYKNPAT